MSRPRESKRCAALVVAPPEKHFGLTFESVDHARTDQFGSSKPSLATHVANKSPENRKGGRNRRVSLRHRGESHRGWQAGCRASAQLNSSRP